MEEEIEQHRRGGQRQQQPVRLSPADAAPQGDNKPGNGKEEDQGRNKGRLRDEEFAHVCEAAIRRGVQRATELLDERRPAVLGVPHDDRAEQGQRDDSGNVGFATFQPAPHFSRCQQPSGKTEYEEDAGVFAEHQATDGNTDKIPPLAAAAAPDQRQPDAAQQPEQQRGRVDRHDDREDRRVRRHVEPQHGEQPDAPFTEKDQRQGAKQHRNKHHRQEGHAPNAQDGVAEQRRPEAEQIGYHRRVIEIARRQMARPQPVIGFVGFEIHPTRDPAPQSQHRQQQHQQRRRCGRP